MSTKLSIERTARRISSQRLASVASALLGAAPLCAIATVGPRGRAHVNTAYFAWSPRFEIVWLSAPDAAHSRNLARDPSAAIAAYDSRQRWGGRDRGIQLFGTASEVDGAAIGDAERLYARRFEAYEPGSLEGYRFYSFRPRTVKLFDERRLGGGTFVTARVGRAGRFSWVRTELYSPD